jgi:hypothetical protein
LAREKGIPEHGAPLSDAWEVLRAEIKDGLARSRLSSFMRYCSANSVAPAEVDETAVDHFIDYRSRCGKPDDTAFRRLLARAWNGNVRIVPGWPTQQLVEPPVKAAVEIEWEAFPKGLRQDIDQYLRGLTRIRKSRTGQRIRPLKEKTIGTRRAELQAAARMAVKLGVPIEKLESLSALLAPAVAEDVLDAFSNRPFGVKHFQTIHRRMSMLLAGSCFSSESAPRPFHHGVRRRGGTIYWAALPSDERRIQATKRTHLIHRPARDIMPPRGGARVSSYSL